MAESGHKNSNSLIIPVSWSFPRWQPFNVDLYQTLSVGFGFYCCYYLGYSSFTCRFPIEIHHPSTDENIVDLESSQTIECLHKEMNEWRSEHNAWLNDIASWQREHKRAELMLHELDRALPLHSYALEDHADAIRQHIKRISTYEGILKKYISNEKQDAAELKNLLEEHQLQEAQHTNERQRHKTFRNIHLKAMAELTRITKMLKSTE